MSTPSEPRAAATQRLLVQSTAERASGCGGRAAARARRRRVLSGRRDVPRARSDRV